MLSCTAGGREDFATELSALHFFAWLLRMLPHYDHSGCRFGRFKLLAHFLDLRCLRFETRRESFNFLLLLRDGGILLYNN
jgi:hypothetical protein